VRNDCLSCSAKLGSAIDAKDTNHDQYDNRDIADRCSWFLCSKLAWGGQPFDSEQELHANRKSGLRAQLGSLVRAVPSPSLQSVALLVCTLLIDFVGTYSEAAGVGGLFRLRPDLRCPFWPFADIRFDAINVCFWG